MIDAIKQFAHADRIHIRLIKMHCNTFLIGNYIRMETIVMHFKFWRHQLWFTGRKYPMTSSTNPSLVNLLFTWW